MKTSILALLAGASSALAAIRGFNYGAQGQDYNSYASQFTLAAGLAGTTDFTSARLYTMIQEGTTNTPTDAIQAAIDTKTTLLLGLWASVDSATFANEITALTTAISQHGSTLTDLVIGISVGSEDLYRISPIGISNKSGVGQSPDILVEYINQVRAAIKGTALASTPVGHVDTWNVYVNSTNAEVITACDFLGLDEYPYYQTTDSNPIDNSATLFFQAYDRVSAAASGKPIWITETGWPVSGPESNLAIASNSNAETYWQAVTCQLMSRGINFWYYILSDAGSTPSFGVSSNGVPLYNLTCNPDFTLGTTTSSTAHSSTATSGSTATGTGSTGASTTATSGTLSTASTSVASATSTGSLGASSFTLTTSVTTGTTAGGSGTSTDTSFASSTAATAVTTFSQATTATSTSASASVATTGAASRLEGPMAALAIGAVVAAIAL